MLTSRSFLPPLYRPVQREHLCLEYRAEGSSRNVEFSSISSRHSVRAAPTYLRSYCRRYICAARQWRDGRLLMDPGLQRSRRVRGVRGMRHFAEVHGLLELLVSTDVPDSLPRFTSSLAASSPVCLGSNLARISAEWRETVL
ncbi:hypothetical protein EVAR_84595_1 [Eumeta japonica]|uniref:Uncharacterized protein n=1 Tax=Eumeta variegata TaxID=151549 RepID=A0A4C1ZFT8_EUMVA|nr:hypothetical protein EVAR_84595_1 [Eumeta japonica]